MLNEEYEEMLDKFILNLSIPQMNHVIDRLKVRMNQLAIYQDHNIEGIINFNNWSKKKSIIKRLAFMVCHPNIEYDEQKHFYEVTLSMVAKIPLEKLEKAQGIGKYVVNEINDVLVENGFNKLK